jgi:acyl dehydratase
MGFAGGFRHGSFLGIAAARRGRYCATHAAKRQSAFTAPWPADHNGREWRRGGAPGDRMAKTVTRQELTAMVGRELGASDWFLIDQGRVDAFADVTLDHQFVHVDPERAKATPFGGTIAHGFLTLSLLVHLCLPFIPVLANRKLVVNYGFDKVRFSSPVRVGKRIRAVGKLGDVSERRPGNVTMRVDVTVEIEGEEKPALVAEWLSLHVVE